MANVTVRNLPDDVQKVIRHLAAKNHRSMEAEIRAILSTVAAQELEQGFGQSLRGRFAGVTGADLSDLRDRSDIEGAVFE